MSKTIVYVIALVVVSLIAGTLLGVVLSHRRVPPGYGQIPGRPGQGQGLGHERGPLERLSKILNLSADQKVKLTEILKESHQEVMQIQHKTKETFLEVKNKVDARIREILTPQQQEKFSKLESDLQQRMREKRAHFGGAPGKEFPQPEPAE